MTRGASIHPAAWWCWAIGAATAASSTTHTLVLALLVATVSLVVVTCRGDSPGRRPSASTCTSPPSWSPLAS